VDAPALPAPPKPPLAKRALLTRLASCQGRKYDTPDLGLQDLADWFGVTRSFFGAVLRGRIELSNAWQYRLSDLFVLYDAGTLAKERNGAGRWVLRRAWRAPLEKVAAAPRTATLSIELTATGPRLKLPCRRS